MKQLCYGFSGNSFTHRPTANIKKKTEWGISNDFRFKPGFHSNAIACVACVA